MFLQRINSVIFDFFFRYYEFVGDENFATLLTYAQGESLELQLQFGARHLDIRVAYCEIYFKQN